MSKQKYYKLKEFENIYLEDSYVLKIQELPTEIVFTLDVVLTEQHPLYTTPSENEQYCYKRASIVFPKVREIVWEEQNPQKFMDASGEYDYGNIDSFYVENGNYYLSGDWGRVKIVSADPRLHIN